MKLTVVDQIKKSVYQPDFYQALKDRPLSYSLGYFLKLTALLSLVVTIIASFFIVPAIVSTLTGLKSEVAVIYPDELEITIDKGLVSTNVAEPYFIPFPKQLDQAENTDQAENLLVIDTEADNLISAYDRYDTLVLLSHDSLVYRGQTPEGQVTVQKLDSDLGLKVTESNVLALVDRIDNYFVIIPPLVVLALFGGLFVALLSLLVWLLPVALVLWLVYLLARDRRSSPSFGFVYRIVLHAVTLGLVIKIILVGLNIDVYLPFLLTIITIGVALANIPPTGNRRRNDDGGDQSDTDRPDFEQTPAA